MAIALICPNKDPKPWVKALHNVDPSLDIQIWPNISAPKDIEFALCWDHPQGVLNDFPNLKSISSMGAGVDQLLKDINLPSHVPIVRIIDPELNQSMFEYVCAAVMKSFRQFGSYLEQQKIRDWQQLSQPKISETTIGIMGLGQIGSYNAQQFIGLGFKVCGWSRSEKNINGIHSYCGIE